MTKRFIATVSGSAIGSITYEFSGDDALVRDFLGGGLPRSSDVIDFGTAADLIGYEDAIAAAVRGRQGGDAMSPWSHAHDIAGRQTDWTVIRKFDQTVTWTAVIIMIVLVRIVQGIANAIAKRILKLQR